jgi:hypothetical protein
MTPAEEFRGHPRLPDITRFPCLETSGPWYWMHRRDTEFPNLENQGIFRFDLPGSYGDATFYVGCTKAAAFLETLGGIRPIPERLIDERQLTRLRPQVPWHIADFCDEKVLNSLGISYEPYIGDYISFYMDRPCLDYRYTQALASRLRANGYHGIRYLTSHQRRPTEMSIALFDQGELDVLLKAAEPEPMDVMFLSDMCQRFDIEILPDDPIPW